MRNYKSFAAISLVILLYSCSNKLDGKIETRNGDKVYLVNGSPTKAFKFTIKTTTITNDSLYQYQTDIIQLSPGDERFLGTPRHITTEYHPDNSSNFDSAIKAYNDGKIKLPAGAVLINTDTIPKFMTIKEEYKYEVTGQLEVKYSPKKEPASTSTN